MQAPSHAIDAVTHSDPYPYYAALRACRPIFFDDALGLWVASTAATVQAALAEPALRVRPPGEPVPRALLGTPAGEVFAQLVRMNDGAFHVQHKPAVKQAASRYSLEAVAQASRDAAADLLPRLAANAFLTALPVQAMARLLGVEAPALEPTVQWVHQFTQGIAAGASAQAVAAASEAAAALMAQGQAQGLAPVAAANRIALMQQSLDATAGLLGNAACLLQERPAVLADATPAGLRAFLAEVARWNAPVQNTRRFAAQEVVLAGQTVQPGQGVLLVLASANRDPALNERPDDFEVARPQRRSLTFGAAAHACPGELIAIELVAACLGHMAGTGLSPHWFGRRTAYRPLPNARIPEFQP